MKLFKKTYKIMEVYSSTGSCIYYVHLTRKGFEKLIDWVRGAEEVGSYERFGKEGVCITINHFKVPCMAEFHEIIDKVLEQC